MASTTLARATLQDLETANGLLVQLQILKRIKIELNGHLSRKIEYLQYGLLPRLAHILAHIGAHQTFQSGVTGQDGHQHELLLTQVVQLLCILVHGWRCTLPADNSC